MDTDTLKHPEYCASCDEYYAYRDGVCWECWHAQQEETADIKEEEIKMSNDYEPPMVIRKSRMPALTPESTPLKPVGPDLCFTDEYDFFGWPIALGLALAAMLACWGLFHVFLWLGRV